MLGLSFLDADADGLGNDEKAKKIVKKGQTESAPVTNLAFGKYIPPSLRKLHGNKDMDVEKQKRERLSKQLKGLLNRYFFVVYLIQAVPGF